MKYELIIIRYGEIALKGKPTSGTATIAAGTTTVVVVPGLSFTAVDDSIYEPTNELFNISLDSIMIS